MSDGICCVEFAQVGVEKFIKLANQLGIEWLVVADNDTAGSDYIRSARNQIGSLQEDRHLHTLAHGDMEVFLCMEGYGSVYEGNISRQKKDSVTADKGTQEYWQQVTKASSDSKPQNAAAVIEKIEHAGADGIPKQLQEILDVALDLAMEAM